MHKGAFNNSIDRLLKFFTAKLTLVDKWSKWKEVLPYQHKHLTVSFPGSCKPRIGFSQPRVPAHNCMNDWLGEPFLGFQLPGRGIFRNFINKELIWNTLIILMAKQKITGNFTFRFFFLIRKTKNLQVKKIVKNNFGKSSFFHL